MWNVDDTNFAIYVTQSHLKKNYFLEIRLCGSAVASQAENCCGCIIYSVCFVCAVHTQCDAYIVLVKGL